MLFAAVDIGSNSIRHLVVRYSGEKLLYLESSSTITRITGKIGVKGSEISAEGLGKTLVAISMIKERLEHIGVEKDNRLVFATESIRQAPDPEKVKRSIADILEDYPEVLSGEQEAMAGFEGTRAALGYPGCVFDLGGGSIEIAGRDVFSSLPLGAVRLTNAWGEDRASIEKAVKEALSERSIPKGPIAGTGGTSSSAVMMLKKISRDNYHPSLLHGRVVTSLEIDMLAEKVKAMSFEQRKNMTGLEPERADIIVAGLSAIHAILEYAGAVNYSHSECGVMWGVITKALERRGFSVKGVDFEHDPSMKKG